MGYLSVWYVRLCFVVLLWLCVCVCVCVCVFGECVCLLEFCISDHVVVLLTQKKQMAGALKKLKILKLRDNGIVSLPATLNEFECLQLLDLTDNLIRELTDESIASAAKLTTLLLTGNMLRFSNALHSELLLTAA